MRTKAMAKWFGKFSNRVTHLAGSPVAFVAACCIVIIWAVLGPVFHYSDTWQLVINTGTTIVTFLMVFLIQQSQNKDTAALHLKLNELLSAVPKASDYLIAVEDLSEEELIIIRKYYEKMLSLTKKKAELSDIYSEEEAIKRVNEKFNGG